MIDFKKVILERLVKASRVAAEACYEGLKRRRPRDAQCRSELH
jgi:hypothetical protein